MDFVVPTDFVLSRWDYRRLIRNPIVYTYGTNATPGYESGYKLAVNINDFYLP